MKYGDEALACPADGAQLLAEGQDPRIGRTVGSYVISRCLGRGGMGAVYQAEHPAIGSRVAIKFLHRRYAADPGIVERFFNEARAVNLIGHENIVSVSDFAAAEDGSPYFVMEFLEGQPLSAWIGRPRDLFETGPVLLQVADGLQAAHERGIVHRDLKPDNLFLVTQRRRTNVVKIVDFGIAKLTHETPNAGRTQTGVVMGTAQYMAPEQAGGEVQRIGPASDVYSLGVIMFQLATGRLPFEGANFGELLVGHLMKPPPAPREFAPSIPEAYEAVILRCLEKQPEQRFGSMAELYDAIAAVLDAHGLPHEPPATRSNPPPARISEPPRRISRPPTTATELAALEPVLPTAPAPVPPRRTGLVAGVLACAVVIGAALVAWKLRGAPPATTMMPTTPIAPLAGPSAPVREVRIGVTSLPAGARATIVQDDRSTVVTTPGTATLRRDVAATLRLELPGFAPLAAALDTTRDAEFSFPLTPLPPPSPAESKPVVKPVAGKPAAKAPRVVGDGMVDVDL